MNIVTVNGRTYNLPNNGNVSVIGTIVYFNGKPVVDCEDFEEKEITIVVNGDNNTVTSDCGNIKVNGNAGNVSTKSGDIEISGNANEASTVSGDIDVMGSIHGNCKTVSGDIKARKVSNNDSQVVSENKTSWFKELLFSIFGDG